MSEQTLQSADAVLADKPVDWVKTDWNKIALFSIRWLQDKWNRELHESGAYFCSVNAVSVWIPFCVRHFGLRFPSHLITTPIGMIESPGKAFVMFGGQPNTPFKDLLDKHPDVEFVYTSHTDPWQQLSIIEFRSDIGKCVKPDYDPFANSWS